MRVIARAENARAEDIALVQPVDLQSNTKLL